MLRILLDKTWRPFEKSVKYTYPKLRHASHQLLKQASVRGEKPGKDLILT